MYSHDMRQLSFSEFILPFAGKLDGQNRWVRLAELVPWQRFEKQYAALFSPGQGAPAKPFRMALAALIIRERLNCTDDELVEQIRENPYLQFFLGFETFTHEYPFDSSMMVHFRKRISNEMLCEINEALVDKLLNSQTPRSDDETPESGASMSSSERPPPAEKNRGKLILDASCAPADISFPTDAKLLNATREKTRN